MLDLALNQIIDVVSKIYNPKVTARGCKIVCYFCRTDYLPTSLSTTSRAQISAYSERQHPFWNEFKVKVIGIEHGCYLIVLVTNKFPVSLSQNKRSQTMTAVIWVRQVRRISVLVCCMHQLTDNMEMI